MPVARKRERSNRALLALRPQPSNLSSKILGSLYAGMRIDPGRSRSQKPKVATVWNKQATLGPSVQSSRGGVRRAVDHRSWGARTGFHKVADHPITGPLAAGTMGVIPWSGDLHNPKNPDILFVRIVQIVGPDEILAEIPVTYYQRGDDGRIYKHAENESVYIKGLSIEDVADDQQFQTKLIFKVTKTKRCRTSIGGTNTVFVLEPAKE